MAIYSTIFLCEPERLPAGFPGWKLPLPLPVVRKTLNPFTREEMTITTRAPEWHDVDSNEAQPREHTVVWINGSYEDYLERRIPPFVQSQPHWCSKNLMSVELAPLVDAVTNAQGSRLEHALYAHPSCGASLEAFPDEFVAQLSVADGAQLRALAEKWAAIMSTPEYTHSVSGERVQDDWIVDDALDVLRPLGELAKQRSGGQWMYLLTEA